MYVALTRAQAQVVTWWAPSRDEYNGGLSRLLRDRRPGETTVRERCDPKAITDDDALARFREEAAGGPVIEEVADRDGAGTARATAVERSVRQAFPPFHRHHLAAYLLLGLVRAVRRRPA